MGEGSGWLRARAIASAWFPVLVVVLVALAAVGGWATMTAHATPGTTEQRSEQAHWTVTGGFDHSAMVTRENPVFERGTVLSDRQTYYRNAAPVLDGEFTAEYTSVDASEADLAVDADLVVREVGEDVVYWSERTQLADTESTVASGAEQSVSFSVNVSEVAQRRAEIQDGLGQTSGDVETFVAVDVTAAGTADEGPAELSFTHRLPVSIEGDTYTVASPGQTSETLTTTETVQVERSYGPLRSFGGPVLLLGATGGLLALAVGRRRDLLALSDDERRRLTFQRDRETFDEWIVEVRLPDAVHDRPRADAESLADLVDFAIDTNTGVIEDPDSGTFYAVGEQVLVAYEPPRPDRTASSDGSAIETVVAGVGVGKAGEQGDETEGENRESDRGQVDGAEERDQGIPEADSRSAGENGGTRDAGEQEASGEESRS